MFHESTVHASPLLYDIDMDGIREVMMTTYDGEIVFYDDKGIKSWHKVVVPPLKVSRSRRRRRSVHCSRDSRWSYSLNAQQVANPFFSLAVG